MSSSGVKSICFVAAAAAAAAGESDEEEERVEKRREIGFEENEGMVPGEKQRRRRSGIISARMGRPGTNRFI